LETTIVIKFDVNDEGMEFTIAQAKEIYEQLDKIFSNKPYITQQPHKDFGYSKYQKLFLRHIADLN